MSNSEPVYSFRDLPPSTTPDLSGINEILGHYTCFDPSAIDGSSDLAILQLRHELLALMVNTPECSSDVPKLLEDVHELLVEQIYAGDDRDAIARECLSHWKKTLVPRFTDLCVHTVKTKLTGVLPVGSLVDIGFSLEQGISNGKPWEELLVDDVGPAVTNSDITTDRMRRALSLIKSEYESAFRIATL